MQQSSGCGTPAFPCRIGTGEISLAQGEVELKPHGGAILQVQAGEAVEKMIELLKQVGS